MEASNTNDKKYANISFSVGDEVLLATPEPDQLEEPLTGAEIERSLNQSGYGSHKLDDNLVQQLIQLSSENATKPLSLEPHTNASINIEVRPDQLTATLIYKPAYCGDDITEEEIFSALVEIGIPEENIDRKQLQGIVLSKEPLTEIVAKGMAAVNGEDCYFEILFRGDSEKRPEEYEDGHVDHYETHDYVTVTKGTALMRRHPATEGTSGITIFDEVLQPVAGKDNKFELNKTVALSPDDPDLLIAGKSGHPIASERSVLIDETLTLNEASLETGNVHFDGSVFIKGEVKPNIIIEASGDIHVSGLVENARLIAGNNITIGAGVVSSQLYDDDDHDDSFDYGCKIEAENDIQLRYCNSIYAQAGGSILIENYSMHSHLEAKVDVIAGINNGKGVLLGGEIHAEQGIKANTIGSEGYVRTDLYCAKLSTTRKQFRRCQNRLNRIKQELGMLNDVLDRIKASGSPATVGKLVLEKAKRIHREIKELSLEQQQELANLRELEQQLEPGALHNIQAYKKVYPNIHITIKDIKTRTAHTHSQCSIKVVDGEIEFRDPEKQ